MFHNPSCFYFFLEFLINRDLGRLWIEFRITDIFLLAYLQQIFGLIPIGSDAFFHPKHCSIQHTHKSISSLELYFKKIRLFSLREYVLQHFPLLPDESELQTWPEWILNILIPNSITSLQGIPNSITRQQNRGNFGNFYDFFFVFRVCWFIH